MSRDSTHTHLHMHHPSHADLLEEFTLPLSSHPLPPLRAHHPYNSVLHAPPPHHHHHPAHPYPSHFTTASAPAAPTTAALPATHLASATTHASGALIAHDELDVPAHLLPPNPEDEDDVVPEMHAAFGIVGAMGGRGERAWRDFGALEEMVKGVGVKEEAVATGAMAGRGAAGGRLPR